MSKRVVSSTSSNPPQKRRTMGSPKEELLKLLWVLVSNAISSDDPLSSHWSPSQEKEFLLLCDQDPALATTTVIELGQFHFTPLVVLILFCAKLSLVQAFCKKFPQAVRTKSNGMYPFEIACDTPYGTSGVMPFLANEYPAGAVEKDYISRFMRIGRSHDWKKVDLSRAEKEPDSLFRRAIKLDFTCRQQDITKLLLEQCPGVEKSFESKLAVFMPQMVDLNLDMEMQQEALGAWQRSMQQLGEFNCLEILRLHVLDWPTENTEYFISALFGALARTHNLEDLLLAWRERHDVRDSSERNDGGLGVGLASLLGRNKLEELTVKNPHPKLSYEPIFEALKHNTSLTSLSINPGINTKKTEAALLKVLTDSNSSLHHVNSYCGGDAKANGSIWNQIDYLCELNQLGRDKARNQLTSRAGLCDLMECAARAYYPWDSANIGYRWDDANTGGCGYVYGLLRECPSIWCGWAVSSFD